MPHNKTFKANVSRKHFSCCFQFQCLLSHLMRLKKDPSPHSEQARKLLLGINPSGRHCSLQLRKQASTKSSERSRNRQIILNLPPSCSCHSFSALEWNVSRRATGCTVPLPPVTDSRFFWEAQTDDPREKNKTHPNKRNMDAKQMNQETPKETHLLIPTQYMFHIQICKFAKLLALHPDQRF